MNARRATKAIVVCVISFGIVAMLTFNADSSENGAIAEVGCVPFLASPPANATLDNGRADRTDSIVWDFDWSGCEGATSYHLYVRHLGAKYPVINTMVTKSQFHYECSGCYIANQNRFNWTWQVRAKNNDEWGSWSKAKAFSVEPLDSDRMVGGSVTGVGSIKVTCLNMTTGEEVIIQNAVASWNCEAAGLVINKGDIIRQTITGIAD